SDRKGDRYPLSPEELALISSQQASSTSTVQPPADSHATSPPKIFHRWGYFLNTEELINVYKECGGKHGNFDPQDPDDIDHARRAIFLYLMPGRVQVWFAILGQQVGVVFFVGKPVSDIRESVDRGLARRCKDMFQRSPDPCRVVEGDLALHWDLHSRDRTVHRLCLTEFWQYAFLVLSAPIFGTDEHVACRSDRMGDRYPLSPEELARFPLQPLKRRSSEDTIKANES
ncbi:hypothetical protein FRC11_007895, partial [Ceratobasidium sp. 423]